MIKGLQNPLTFFNKKKSLAVLLFGKKALPLHRKKDKVSPLKSGAHHLKNCTTTMATTATTTATAILAVVAAMQRNTFGVCVITDTEPKMNKRGNPYFGRVRAIKYMTNVAVGRDYENAVHRVAERTEGADASNFAAAAPSGMEWEVYPYILRGIKDPSQKYLRLTRNGNTTSRTTYMVDGREATAAETEAIKAFIPKHGESAKQAACGIAAEDQVKPFAIKVENIVTIYQGDKVYKRN